jgi:rhodanese-related sulfurtransferase
MTSVDELLAGARARLRRVSADEAESAARDGALLVDIRSDSQRARDGVIPGSKFIPRNVLEWRCDPASEWRDSEVVGRRLIVFCNEGYQSSLVAAMLQQLGHADATDLIGGFQAWRAAGLEVVTDPDR